MTTQGLSPSGHFLGSFLVTPLALYPTLEPHKASRWPLHIPCFCHMSLLLCSHGCILPLVPSPFPPPCAGDQALQGFPTELSSLCPLVHTFFLSTCFLLRGHPGLWVLWRLTDKDISCFVLLSLVRRKPRVDTFSESRDVEWDHSRTGVVGGMAWGGVRFPNPHWVSVCLIQSENWRGSRLNPGWSQVSWASLVPTTWLKWRPKDSTWGRVEVTGAGGGEWFGPFVPNASGDSSSVASGHANLGSLVLQRCFLFPGTRFRSSVFLRCKFISHPSVNSYIQHIIHIRQPGWPGCTGEDVEEMYPHGAHSLWLRLTWQQVAWQGAAGA